MIAFREAVAGALPFDLIVTESAARL